jgi:hypothetical protein
MEAASDGTNAKNAIPCWPIFAGAGNCVYAAGRSQYRLWFVAQTWRGGGQSVQPREEARRFFADNPVALRVSSYFLFGSSVPLGIYAATVVSRLRFLGVRAAGTYIALGGGFAAAASLAISGLCAWVLSVPEVSASKAASRLMHFMVILFGGVGFAVAFGLLTAGVSVTSHFFGLLPRWQVWFGIGIAAAGELSSLSLVALLASPLIPVVRFCGFVWLIAVGATLPQTIRASEVPAGTVAT